MSTARETTTDRLLMASDAVIRNKEKPITQILFRIESDENINITFFVETST